MLVQIHSDNNLNKTDEFTNPIINMVSTKLNRFSDHITRVEVYFTDEDGGKNTPRDKRCLMEARFEKSQPLAATNYGDTYELAAVGAVEKLKASLTTKLDKIRNL